MARSGMAAARLIRQLGGTPFVSDLKSAVDLADEIAELRALNIEFEIGEHSDRLLDVEFVVLSPGIPASAPIVQKVLEKGLPVFSEIELASWFCRGRMIAVTGSNGKTTTTTLLGAMLNDGGVDAVVCGNIGYPFSDAVLSIPENGFAVVEVSSFQLELIEEFRPYISMILNITPDHLDRYEDFDGYKAAKYRICDNQVAADYLILNADDAVLGSNHIRTDAHKVQFSITRNLPAGVFQRGGTLVGVAGEHTYNIIDIDQIRIPGPHNLQNAAAAGMAALLVGVTPESIAGTLRSFPGVEHRMEDVGTIAGIRFINDSKATNVDSVCYALRSVKTQICLIAGGREKGTSFEPLLQHGQDKIKEIILIGEAREKMFEALGKKFPVQFASDLEDAVRRAFQSASPGDTVMLSPACASFDMFDSYEHRGKMFKRIVASLRNNRETLQENAER